MHPLFGATLTHDAYSRFSRFSLSFWAAKPRCTTSTTTISERARTEWRTTGWPT